MASKRKRKLRFKGFDAPAHVARVAVGLIKSDKHSRVTEEALARAEKRVSALAGGNSTMYRATGRYTHHDGSTIHEPTAVFEVLALDVPCVKFKRNVRKAAQAIARDLQQETVLAAVQCAGGKFDVTFEAGVPADSDEED